jgi:hypothetical protein
LAGKIGDAIKSPFAKGFALFSGRDGGGNESDTTDAAGTAAGGPLYSAMKEIYEKKDDPIVEKLTGLFRKKEDSGEGSVKEAVETSRDEDEKRAKREERLERRRARKQLRATRRSSGGRGMFGGMFRGLGKGLKFIGPLFKGLKVAGKLLAKLAIPLTLAIGAFDFFNGFFNASSITGIQEDMLTTTDKVKAGLAKALEGLTFGLISAESWFDGTMASYADKVKLAIDNTIKQFTDKLAGVEKWVNDSIKSVVDLAKSALGKAIETITFGRIKADDLFKKEEPKPKKTPKEKPKKRLKSGQEQAAEEHIHKATKSGKSPANQKSKPAYNLTTATHDPTAHQNQVSEKSRQVKSAKGKLDQRLKDQGVKEQQAFQNALQSLIVKTKQDPNTKAMLTELQKLSRYLKQEGDVPQKISNETINAVLREQERLAN